MLPTKGSAVNMNDKDEQLYLRFRMNSSMAINGFLFWVFSKSTLKRGWQYICRYKYINLIPKHTRYPQRNDRFISKFNLLKVLYFDC